MGSGWSSIVDFAIPLFFLFVIPAKAGFSTTEWLVIAPALFKRVIAIWPKSDSRLRGNDDFVACSSYLRDTRFRADAI
jgi:hypothetical protein